MSETEQGTGGCDRSRALVGETGAHAREGQDVRRMSHNPATTVPAPVLCPRDCPTACVARYQVRCACGIDDNGDDNDDNH
jgi:hypothetical protein